MFVITSLYAALIAILFLALSFRVIAYRRGKLVSLGAEGHPALETRMRAQGNCAEYAPIGLILLGLVEAAGYPVLLVHALGALLFLGRLLHGVGFWGDRPVMRLRVVGMLMTITMIAVSALLLLAAQAF